MGSIVADRLIATEPLFAPNPALRVIADCILVRSRTNRDTGDQMKIESSATKNS
jgi:hypothetical protein